MFWDKNYTPSQNIELLLAKENVTVEEFLEEDDILQECKTLKSLTNYFTRPDVIKRLIELITTEPPEDLPLAQRFRHANMACEVLTFGLPSLNEKLLSDPDSLKVLYSYLENEPPLHPLLSSFFSKTFSMIFTKKPEQDWFLYQQMCLKFLEYIKSQNNFLDLICKHFSTSVVPDFILKMLRDIDGGDIKRNLYEWLTEEKLVERLIGILGNSQEIDKYENVADFLCDLIEHGRSMRAQEEQKNPLLENLESEATIENLINVILDPNAGQGSIVSGISVVLMLIKPLNEMDLDAGGRYHQEEKIHGEILATVISVVAPRIKDFNELLKNPPKKNQSVINLAQPQDPFGNTRLQVIRLFRMLLETFSEKIFEAICETDFFETIMQFFKKYCWNNFLHSEVQKCFSTVFDLVHAYKAEPTQAVSSDVCFKLNFNEQGWIPLKEAENQPPPPPPPPSSDQKPIPNIQRHVVESKIISKLMECWQANRDSESGERKRRLGYMGHLVTIFKDLTKNLKANKALKTLIEENLDGEKELELWKSITHEEDGELFKLLDYLGRLLTKRKDLRMFNRGNESDVLSDPESWEGTNNYDRSDLHECFEYFKTIAAPIDFDYPCTTSVTNFWDKVDPFDSNDTNKLTGETTNSNNDFWADFEESIPNFDSHFDLYISDMGDSLGQCSTTGLTSTRTTSKYFDLSNENDDNNVHHQNSNDDNDVNNDMMHAFKDNNANLEKLTKLENTISNAINTNLTAMSDNDLVTYSSLGTMDSKDTNQEIKKTEQLESDQNEQKPKEENENNTLKDEEEQEQQQQLQQHQDLKRNPMLTFEDYDDDDFDDDEGMWTKPLGPPIDDKEIHENNETKNGPLDVSSLPPDLKADIITNQQLIEACETAVSKSFDIDGLETEAYVDIKNIEELNSFNVRSELIKNKLDKPNIIGNNLDEITNIDNSNETADSKDTKTAITTETTTSSSTTIMN